MTKFCRWCTQQRQHEKSQFCTVPGSPANFTKQGLLAVRSTKVPREPILVTEKWRRKFFSALRRNDQRYAPPPAAWNSCARATSVSWLRHCCTHMYWLGLRNWFCLSFFLLTNGLGAVDLHSWHKQHWSSFHTPNFALVAILCTFNSQGSFMLSVKCGPTWQQYYYGM